MALSTDEKLDKAVADALQQHKREVDIALELCQQRMSKIIVTETLESLFDQFFVSDKLQTILLQHIQPRSGSRHPVSADELRHLYHVSEDIFGPFQKHAFAGAAKTVSDMIATLVQHLMDVVVPVFRRVLKSIVVADRRESSERFHSQVEFLRAEADARVALIANHELYGRYHAPARGSNSGGNVPSRNELSSLIESAAQRVTPDAAAALRRRVGSSSSEECLSALMESFNRELVAWKAVENLQQRIDAQEVGEEQRCLAFEAKTQQAADASIQKAEAVASALQGELNQLRMESLELQDTLHDATELIHRLDERCALQATQLAALVATTTGGGTPFDFFKATRAAAKQNDVTPVTTHRSSTELITGHASRPEDAEVRAKVRASALAAFRSLRLRTDMQTVPPVCVTEQHRAFAELAVEMAACRKEVETANARAERAEKDLRALHRQHVKELLAAHVEAREAETALYGTLKAALQQEYHLKQRVGVLEKRLKTATVQFHFAGDPVVDDLARRVRTLESRVERKPQQDDTQPNVPRPPSRESANVSRRPRTARDRAEPTVPLEEGWLADTGIAVKDSARTEKATSGCGVRAFFPRNPYELGIYRHSDIPKPRRRPLSAASPSARQLKGAFAAVAGIAVKSPRAPHVYC